MACAGLGGAPWSARRIGWGTLSALAISGRAGVGAGNEIAQIRELAAAVSAYHDKVCRHETLLWRT